MVTRPPFRFTPLTLAALLLPTLGAAQTATERAGENPPQPAAERSAVLEQVVITAEKRRSDAQKTSLSVQVMNGDLLRREGKSRLDEAIDGLAGIQLQPANIGQTINVRGMDGGSTGVRASAGFGQADAAANPGVAVIIDGIYQARPEALRASMLDATRVEVMRGNQSTMLGGNAVVGAINVVTNAPIFDYFAKLGTELGNYNRQTYNGVLNVPFGEDQAMRMAFQSSRRDGYARNNGDNEDSQALRLRYRWQASDALNLVAGIERSSVGGHGIQQGALLYQGAWLPASSSTLKNATDVAALGAGYGVTALGCVTTPAASPTPVVYATLGCPATYVMSNPGAAGPTYRDRANPWDDGLPADAWGDTHSQATLTTYSVAAEYETPLGQLTVTPSVQDFRRDTVEPMRGIVANLAEQSQRTLQVEARLASAEQPGAALKWLAGANLFESTTDAYNGQALQAGGAVPSVVTTPGSPPSSTSFNCPLDATVRQIATCFLWAATPDAKQITHSVFANGEYSVTPQLRLLGGLRYQEDEKITTSSVFLYTGGQQTGPGSTDFRYPIDHQSVRYHDLNHRVGAEYDLSSDLMVYAASGTGYQPGVADFDATTPASPKLVSYKQSAIDQWSLGFKSRFLEGTLQVNAEAFKTRFDHYPLNSSPTGQGWNLNTNSDAGTCTHPAAISRTVRGVLATVDSTGKLCVVDGNAPTVTSQGVDLDVVWSLGPDDRLFASAEYLETEVTDGDPRFATPERVQASVATWATLAGGASSITADQAAAGIANLAQAMGAINGLGLANSPRRSLTAAYQHTFRLDNGSRLTTRIQAVHKSSYWTSGQGQSLSISTHAAAVQPSYTQFNLFANWTSADSRIEVAGYVRNATNEVVLQNLNTAPGWWTVSLAPPRVFGISTLVRF